MKMTRDNFQTLLTPIHKKIIWDEYNSKELQYTKVFKVDTMNKKEETYPHIGGFGVWEENTEGNTINEDEMSEGPVARLEARRFDKGYSVTWELTRDDLYGVLKGRGKDGSAKMLGRGFRATQEIEAARIINNGFTVPGYDGVPLFSDNHPLADSALPGDNLITGELTPANLQKAMTLMRQQLGEDGILIQATPKQLIVGPELEMTALEITGSLNKAFEMSNTKNVIQGLEVVVMDYITGTKWALRDPNFENLLFSWRDKVFYDSEKIAKTVDFFMFGFARFDTGYMDWRGLIGSTGEAV